MGSLRDKAIRLTAKGFNLERKKLFKPGSSLILLRPDGGNIEYQVLRTFEKDFIVRYDTFRNQLKVEIATIEDISEVVSKTSNLAFDGMLFDVKEGDIVAPFGDRFSWLIIVEVNSRPYTP